MFPERMKRVEEEMKRELAIMIDREIKDPRLGEGMVSVSQVTVSKDLRQANVYVSRLGDDPEADRECLEALDHAKGFMRRQLNERMRLKYIPELHFHLDTGPRRAMELEDLFRQIHEQNPPDAEAEDKDEDENS